MPRGGKRIGAGRPKSPLPLKKYGVSLTEEQAKLIRKWGKGDLSAGLRWLINSALPLIKKSEEVDVFLIDLVGKVDLPHNNK